MDYLARAEALFGSSAGDVALVVAAFAVIMLARRISRRANRSTAS